MNSPEEKRKQIIDEVPDAVKKVWVIQRFFEDTRIGVGRELWNECQEIINNYPEWFPNTHNDQKKETI